MRGGEISAVGSILVHFWFVFWPRRTKGPNSRALGRFAGNMAVIDNDGQADIVVASNAYGITCPDNNTKQAGVRVFGSAKGSWVRTRRIWNQHTYHVTKMMYPV